MVELAAGYAVQAVAGYAIGKITGHLTKSKRKAAPAKAVVTPAPAPPDPMATLPEPGGALPAVFGHRRVAGRAHLHSKSGTTTYAVYVIAGAPLAAINAVYVNNVLVSIDGSGNVTSAPWASGSNYSLKIRTYDGTQTTADSALDTAFPGWTSAHVGEQIAYAVVEMRPTLVPTAWETGATPDFTFDVLGHTCYDPRNGAHDINDRTTWSFSGNAAILNANYKVHLLGENLPTSLIDWASVEAAADVCDESVTLNNGGTERRYIASLYWTTDERHEDVLDRIGAAHAGGMFLVGTTFRAYTGAFTSSSATITPDDYAGEGLTFADTPPISSSANGVRGRFVSPLQNYELRDFPSYKNATWITDDKGVESWIDLDLSCVASHTQAQRLARIALYKARYGATATVELQAKHLDIVSDDVVTITDDIAVLSAVTYRVASDELTDDYTVRLELERDEASYYAWTAASDEQDMPEENLLTGEAGLRPPGFAKIDTDSSGGIRHNAHIWASPTDYADQIEVRWYASPGGGLSRTETVANTTGVVTTSTLTAVLRIEAQAKNSGSGALSEIVSVSFSAASGNGETESTAAGIALPPPKKPKLKSIASGAAVLHVDQAPGAQSTDLRLYKNTTQDPNTATLVSTQTNGSGGVDFSVSGTAGEVAFFWAKTRKSGTESPVSNALLVVF